MQQRVGTCSLCGGSVIGYRGVWTAVVPPPPDQCYSCGAVAAYNVIQMRRPPGGDSSPPPSSPPAFSPRDPDGWEAPWYWDAGTNSWQRLTSVVAQYYRDQFRPPS